METTHLAAGYVVHFCVVLRQALNVFRDHANRVDPDLIRNLKTLSKTSPTLSIVQLDLCDPSSLERSREVVETLLAGEGLNLVINNAVYFCGANVYEATKEEMMKSFETNAVGPLMVVQTYLPLLKKAAQSQADAPMSCNKAAIINMSTGMASITENSSGGNYPYRLSKAGLNMITSNLSLDLKSDGILCTAIHPGWVKTEMSGANAPLSTEEGVEGIIKVLEGLQGEEGNGKFYHAAKGHIIPW